MGRRSQAGGGDFLGAHMSIAGGVAEAPLRGGAAGCRVIQIFTKNNARWEGKPIASPQASLFKARLGQERIVVCVAHASYLINLCATDGDIWRRSIRTLADEIGRCGVLGIPGLVVHPGCHKGAGERAGIRRAARSLDSVSDLARSLDVRILLENSAGQGTSIGYSFAHLAAIRDLSRRPEVIGFCFDTCHAFAAGYDLRDRRGYEATFSEWRALVGPGSIEVFHLNDCRAPLGARRDRHEHIGFGEIGLPAFLFLLNDRGFARVPKVLETPKQGDGLEDRANLRVLRSLIRRRTAPRGRPRWKASALLAGVTRRRRATKPG